MQNIIWQTWENVIVKSCLKTKFLEENERRGWKIKESGYINDESVIIQMSHEVGKELSDILSQKPEIIELNNNTQKKIILGEIDNGNNS